MLGTDEDMEVPGAASRVEGSDPLETQGFHGSSRSGIERRDGNSERRGREPGPTEFESCQDDRTAKPLPP
jgi:hypothetical protein